MCRLPINHIKMQRNKENKTIRTYLCNVALKNVNIDSVSTDGLTRLLWTSKDKRWAYFSKGLAFASIVDLDLFETSIFALVLLVIEDESEFGPDVSLIGGWSGESGFHCASEPWKMTGVVGGLRPILFVCFWEKKLRLARIKILVVGFRMMMMMQEVAK